jgi:hypothetical protein
MENGLTVAGLLADIVGVAFIGFAFLRRDARTLLEEAQTKWDYSPDVLSALCEQKADNIIGIAFLFVGFVLQLVAAFGWDLSGFSDTVIFAAMLAVFTAAIAARGKLIRHFEAQTKSLIPHPEQNKPRK